MRTLFNVDENKVVEGDISDRRKAGEVLLRRLECDWWILFWYHIIVHSPMTLALYVSDCKVHFYIPILLFILSFYLGFYKVEVSFSTNSDSVVRKHIRRAGKMFNSFILIISKLRFQDSVFAEV